MAGDGVLRGFPWAGGGLYDLNLPTKGASFQDFLSVCGDVGQKVKNGEGWKQSAVKCQNWSQIPLVCVRARVCVRAYV